MTEITAIYTTILQTTASDTATMFRVMSWILGAVLGINVSLLLLYLYRRSQGKGSPFSPIWSVADVWFGAQAVVFLLMVIITPLMFWYMASDPKASVAFDTPRAILWFVLPSSILQNAVFFGVPAFYIVAKYGYRLRDIGLPPLPRRRDWAAGLLLGIGAFFFAHLLGLGVEQLAERYKDVPWIKAALEYEKSNPVAQIVTILPKLGATGLILAVLGIGIGAPLGEEMLFRGFAFNALKHRFGVPAGLLISALLFTLPHTYALGLLPVFVLGVGLAWTYHHSGSLWVPIIIHAVNNTASVLLAFFLPSLTG
jgi:membrane protease YdiL (CAAX protease family)